MGRTVLDKYLGGQAVGLLSLAARGVWAEMCLWMWRESPERGRLLQAGGGPLSVGQLARLLRASEREIGPLLGEIKDAGLVVLDGDVLVCSEMVRDAEISSKRSRAGRRGGVATAHAEANGEAVATANGEASAEAVATANGEASDGANGGASVPPGSPPLSSPLHPPSCSPSYSPSASPGKGSQVNAIYVEYPRKVGAESARKAIGKALRVVPFDRLLERVKAFAAATVGCDRQFIPHPSTWFNQGRWEDDPAEWGRIGRDGQGGQVVRLAGSGGGQPTGRVTVGGL